MNVLIDLHHQDLFYSLQLLFEKRLGWNVYKQVGLDWYHKNYWNVFPHIGTAQQYLGLDQATNHPVGLDGPMKTKDLKNMNYIIEDGIYYVKDPSHNEVIQRGVTFDKFCDMKFDILISSIPQHISPFEELINKYQPQAKHIFQVGNHFGNHPQVKNILASTAPFPTPANANVCYYSQEFDLDLFRYEVPTNHQRVRSFTHYMKEPEVLEQYKYFLSGWDWKTFGAGMDEDLCRIDKIAKEHREKGWLFHIKPEGDGYGYAPHYSYACGRPAIVKANYYQGKLAGRLFTDLDTCIDISKRTIHENTKILNHYAQPEEHTRMCERVYKRFTDNVDFDWDFENKIKPFLEKLL